MENATAKGRREHLNVEEPHHQIVAGVKKWEKIEDWEGEPIFRLSDLPGNLMSHPAKPVRLCYPPKGT